MPFRTVLNRLRVLNSTDSRNLAAEFDALRTELDDMRTKYSALQTALNAGTAVGAAGYPNATMALAPARFTPL